MLKKKQRLTAHQFDRFFSAGRRHHFPLLTLIWSDHETFHGAAVAGKKVSKKAVGRNKLRRRLYSILYRLSREKDLRGVYIVIAKPAAARAPFPDLKKDLTEAVSRTLNPKP